MILILDVNGKWVDPPPQPRRPQPKPRPKEESMKSKIVRRRSFLLSHLGAKVWWMGGCTVGDM